MAFCPSVFKLSFWLLFASLFDGCLRWWGRFWWPWGKFIFYSALSSIGSILLTQRHQFLSSFRWSRFCWPRGTNFIFAVRFLRWGRFRWPWGTNLISVLILVKPILLTSRYQFISCSALSSVESILLTLRHDFDPFGCPHLGGADLIDFEVLVYFLQWIALWHLDSGLVGSCCCR